LPIKALRFDVLYSMGGIAPVGRMLWRRRRSKPRRVVTTQSIKPFGGCPSFGGSYTLVDSVRSWLSRKSVDQCDATIAISQAMAELIAQACDPIRLHVIHSGGPGWVPEPAQIDASSLGGREYFLVVSNDFPHKRLDDIVRAWESAFRNWQFGRRPALVIVGDVESSRGLELKGYVEEPARGKLRIVGVIRDEIALGRLYKGALAHISASACEAFPLTPAEAGAFGCPCILSDIPAHREVFLGRHNFFSPGDVGRLARLLEETANEGRVDDYWEWTVSWQDNAGALIEVFRSLACCHGES
jgi:glycosyltransferase involved in cell wall biosynthesis